MTVLLIDDDEHFRDFFRDAIRLFDESIEVIESDDGDTAFEIFKGIACDLYVIDMNMPRMSGLALTSKIREADKTTPIVLVSNLSAGLSKFKDKILRSGVNLICDKSAPDFTARITSFLDTRQCAGGASATKRSSSPPTRLTP